MSEVAKAREALDFRAAGQTLTPIERAFVTHGLMVCEEYEEQAAGHEDAPLHCIVCASKYRWLELIAAILRDAGLLEGRAILARRKEAMTATDDLRERIPQAIERITSGHAPMRIPADMRDADIVLSECAVRIQSDAALLRERDEQIARYNELIYAVGNKYPGESRHETALRYIRERENHTSTEAKEGGPNA